ncbi:MAG: hypothetical protein ACXAD7_20575 [Candidatus Kariarchaeaceae archaeon]|jgi:hypothetical protein
MIANSTDTKIEQLLSASRAFFVIDSSGILLYNEDFLELDMDADLYAGLFSAINVYAKELDAGVIQTATLEEHKFVFAEDNDSGYLIVMDVDKQMTDEDGAWLLNQILSRFTDMQNLIADDIKGSLSLETLFSDRGKTINWATIQAIREGAIQTQKSILDKVDTLNLSKINMNNRLWVRIRDMMTSMVKNQLLLTGMVLQILKNDHFNNLYAGRNGSDNLKNLFTYMEKKFTDGLVGIEQETEYLKIDDLYCSLFPIMIENGGLLGIASSDDILIRRLTLQVERLVASIERLANK